jgi:hypothetical protein
MPGFSHRSALIALALGTFGTTALFGPPRITVRQVTDPSSAPPGAVLLIEGIHHDEMGKLLVTGRAEGLRQGQRIERPLTLNRIDDGHYSVTRQWSAGMPWVLVFAVEQGEHASHGVAEAMVQVSAEGKIIGIEHRQPAWIANSSEPRRISSREIGDALSRLAVRQ